MFKGCKNKSHFSFFIREIVMFKRWKKNKGHERHKQENHPTEQRPVPKRRPKAEIEKDAEELDRKIGILTSEYSKLIDKFGSHDKIPKIHRESIDRRNSEFQKEQINLRREYGLEPDNKNHLG